MMRALTLLILLLAACGRAPASDPRSAVALALADCARLPAERQQAARYLWRPALAADTKENLKLLTERARLDAAWVNFLSAESELLAPKRLAPDLWRVFLDDYRWKREVWEKLLDVEPYFHVKIVAVVKAEPETTEERTGRRISFDGGRTWQWETRRVERKKKVEARAIAAAAPWLDAVQVAGLIALTQSQVPIVRADWFLFQTAQAAERKAGYYDWLNLGKKLQDFDDLVGANLKASRNLRRAHRAIIGRSSVALQNRGMEGGATLTEGIRFLTEDYARSDGDKNPVRLLLGDAKPDGGEGLGNLPNGLIAMWVQNADSLRLDAVPDNIASDGTSRSPDRRVHAGMCMRCHVEGYRPINDWARRIYAPPFKLESVDYRLQKELRAAYLSQLDVFLERGRKTYADALRVFGFTPATFSRAFAEGWSSYADEDRDLPQLARELGLDAGVLLAKLNAEAERGEKTGKKLDPLLAGLVQGIPLRIEHAEELVPEIYRIASVP